MSKEADVKFRTGTRSDIPLLVDVVVEAEKSGFDKFSYNTIFEMPEVQIRKIFAEIMEEDVRGMELCFSDYLIAEVDGKVAGAMAGWIEGESGQSSTIIKGTLLGYFFPKENMAKAQAKRKILDEMHFNPDMGALVVDHTLILPDFRGYGIYTKLMQEHFRRALTEKTGITHAMTHVLKTTAAALHNCLKMGYVIREEKHSSNPLILEWLPCDTQIILDKKF